MQPAQPPPCRLGKLHLTPVAGGSLCLINTACPWASTDEDLERLYCDPSTSAITTRTAVVAATGSDASKVDDASFDEDPQVHTVRFITDGDVPRGSINSYGYSPHTLSYYMRALSALWAAHGALKPTIISITGTPSSVRQAIVQLRLWAKHSEQTHPLGVPIEDLVAVEVNTSCPNIKDQKAPAGYDEDILEQLLLAVAGAQEDPLGGARLSVGFKMPPYIYEAQFAAFVALLERTPSLAFLTCTNTLGQCAWFEPAPSGGKMHTALPSDAARGMHGYGGLGGESLHALALGNVRRMRTLLDASSCDAARATHVVGAGGVNSGLAALRHREAGAHVVGLATALGREGVGAFSRIVQEVEEYHKGQTRVYK